MKSAGTDGPPLLRLSRDARGVDRVVGDVFLVSWLVTDLALLADLCFLLGDASPRLSPFEKVKVRLRDRDRLVDLAS